jgi:hypothetical protein
VQLVRVEQMELSGQADAARAAIAELLHAGRRDPERVGVVTVKRERPAAEVRLDSLDAGRARPDADRVATARSFKTAGVGPG